MPNDFARTVDSGFLLSSSSVLLPFFATLPLFFCALILLRFLVIRHVCHVLLSFSRIPWDSGDYFCTPNPVQLEARPAYPGPTVSSSSSNATPTFALSPSLVEGLETLRRRSLMIAFTAKNGLRRSSLFKHSFLAAWVAHDMS